MTVTDSPPRRVLSGQLVRFAIIGVASTVLNLVLFALLDQIMGRQVANFVALVLCTVINTAANRFFTFGVRGSQGHAKVQLQSLALLAVTWAATALALVVLHHIAPDASTWWATVTVAAGNAIATVVRFVLLRRWMSPAPTAQEAAEAIPTEL
ncbi:putative flippase GtrA [Branchiibius hedensis]|uniref:Flippase GtrA (Transmembrane translocase of bactoprenol-linked glucose) n=1 Tax=Branchiibius hedensis TaxID=672460 RepID=A0A2Y8ZY10_9MICO|nr:GtrA family protein [Branchiibius hedensis]PWJ27357.1 putative flippase GtrA [Branchiibius hedensis]SSA36168.1 Putative flippase GtrA (transmembrane translocase of bactoprenol-linked glucose) [Branchiibius hedensis]